MHTQFLAEDLNGRYHFAGLGADERMLLKLKSGNIEQFHPDRVQWWGLVKIALLSVHCFNLNDTTYASLARYPKHSLA
jgi:hypothetical protein